MSKNAAAISNQDAEKLRLWIPNFLATFNGMDMDQLSEPLAALFKNVKTEINGLLEKLPPTDGVPAAHEAGYFLNCLMSALTSTQLMLNHAGMRVKELSARASELDPKAVADAVATEIEARVTAGDLVKKDIHVTLCSQAKTEGITEGESRVRGEIEQEKERVRIIGERRQLVTKNSLPPPKDEALLGGTEDEFKTREATAKARVKELAAFKVALNSPVMDYVWGSESDFNAVKAGLSIQRASGSTPAQPLAKPPEADKPLPAFVV